MNIWKTFMAVTFLAAAAFGGVASFMGLHFTPLAVNSFGIALTVGDVIETVFAVLVGGIATLVLARRRHTHA